MKRNLWMLAWCGAAMMLAAQESAQAPEERPDLEGVVLNESGTPIPQASVFIYTAGPRVGPGYI